MLDRIQISDEDTDYVRITEADHTGIIIAVCVVPIEEWRELQASLLKSFLSADFGQAFSYLTGLWALHMDS